MRIGLISPKGSFISNDPNFRTFWEDSELTSTYRHNWSGLSTSLPVIAALTPVSHQVEIVDENVEAIDFSAEYDMVGITAMTQQAPRAYQIADEFRRQGTATVIGGLHATLLPAEATSHADSVIVGEAEYLWSGILEDFSRNRMQSIYESKVEVDLGDSPIPRYDLLKPKRYNVIWVQATRGCPHDCEFCVASRLYGPRYRHKEVSRVIDEIQYIKKHLGNVRIGFADDNLFVNEDFSEELLQGISSLGVRWAGQSDIAIAEKPRLLELIKKSGCTFLFIGFESLIRANLMKINKSGWKLAKLEYYSEYVREIQGHGIGVMGAFIYGFDEDTVAVFEETSDFVIQNYLYDAQFSILTPFPGTRIRQRLLGEHRLLATDWDNYSVFDVNFLPKLMTKEQLQDGILYSYMKTNTKEIYEKRISHFKDIYKKIVS
jgi:radical SAM superfamily enzyme YgiQ (UPF0313 family)